MPPLLSMAEAQTRVLERVRRLPGEQVAVESAAGRVLVESALALVDLPPFASSAMDGFALRARDTPGALRVAGHVAAGRPTAHALAPGEAIGIATGGVVPQGADGVIPIEYVVQTANTVEIGEAVAPGANIRPAGGDVRAGAAVVEPETRLGAAQLGALAAAGLAQVVCSRRPRAAVVSTGTELQTPGRPLGPGQIYESNSPMLAAQLEGAGAVVERLGPVEDDARAHRAVLERALAADVVVTSGGVSVGAYDLVRQVSTELGVEEVFWGVAVKPGKPLAFGVRGDTLVFGLPGNPVSSLVSFELFVRPAVLALQGLADPLPAFRRARLRRGLRRNLAREQLVRARLAEDDEDRWVEPLTGQESHMIARTASADALVHVPRGDGRLEAGAFVRYLELA